MLFFKMTYNEIFRELTDHQIPLADIKMIFDGYFHVEFDRLGILGEKEAVQKEEISNLIQKLESGYPVSYLVGYTDILSMRIFLNEDTLIPRIETEDFVYTYLRDHFDFNHKKVLDLCTGSGFIALAIKKIYKDADVTASDICENALKMAKKNSEFNNFKIKIVKSDFLNDIHEKFDVIISNPPYIEEDSKDVDAPFEPKLALFSGKDGLDSYRSIFHNLDSHLNKEGIAFFEMESTNVKKTVSLMEKENPNYEWKVIRDLYQRERYLQVKKH